MRDLREDEVYWSTHCVPEVLGLEGNILYSGNDENDRLTEEEVRQQLANGNTWAWCIVDVTAGWEGFEGTASLGCCSYKSLEDFEAGTYYKDMRAEALENLNREIRDAAKAINKLA